MGQLYASAVGTTVLQIKEIPLRPADFDGKLCLFAPAKGVDEGKIRTAFGGFGEIVAVVDRRPQRDEIAVHFTSHQAVLDAIKQGAVSGICSGIGALYTDRAYDERGWYASTPESPQQASSRPSLTLMRPPMRVQVLLRGQHQP